MNLKMTRGKTPMSKFVKVIKKMKVKLEVGNDGLVTVVCMSKGRNKGNIRVCDKRFSKSLIKLMNNLDGTWWIGERG